MLFRSDIYGIPVQTVNKEEGPAFGAALLAAVGAGAYKSVAEACQKTLKRSSFLRPKTKAQSAYKEPIRRFKALYPALKSL